MKIIDLSLKEANIIIDVDVDIDNYEPGSYMFTTSIKLNSDDTFKTRDFNETWVTISPENPSTSLEIERRCSGESCLPQLNMSLEWSGSQPYKLGSTNLEIVTIRFKNHGNSSYAQTCAHLKVSGARIARIGCVGQDTIYKCLLPIPIRREAEHLIEMMLNMSESTNKDGSLMVDVKFYNNSCSLESEFQSLEFVVPFELDTEAVVLSGSSNNRTLADSEVIDTALETFEDQHEYTIENNGSISWQDVRAVIKWSNTRIIEEYKILLTSVRYKCDVYNATDEMTYICMFNLDRQSAVKIIAIIEVSEKAVEKYVIGKTINVTSKLELYLLPSETKKELSLTTVIQYHKELSLGHNKFVIIIIAIIVAVLILALLIFVLWKFGFFNRNTKKKLIEEKKEDERRKSMKRPTETNTEDINVIEGNAETLDDDLEVIEEPLQAEPNTGDTSDQLSLICEAEIH
ncbi:integrin alpha-D-like [Battus philenor]|uniref:integrin alpha-D-like n=1 Tax=Battus philenor TaxID=42288 RepID=UPI0035CF1BE4